MPLLRPSPWRISTRRLGQKVRRSAETLSLALSQLVLHRPCPSGCKWAGRMSLVLGLQGQTRRRGSWVYWQTTCEWDQHAELRADSVRSSDQAYGRWYQNAGIVSGPDTHKAVTDVVRSSLPSSLPASSRLFTSAGDGSSSSSHFAHRTTACRCSGPDREHETTFSESLSRRDW